jgi:hypothetical protein
MWPDPAVVLAQLQNTGGKSDRAALERRVHTRRGPIKSTIATRRAQSRPTPRQRSFVSDLDPVATGVLHVAMLRSLIPIKTKTNITLRIECADFPKDYIFV